MEILLVALVGYALGAVLLAFLLYLVIRRAVRDGIWDARRLEPDLPRPGVDMQRRPRAGAAASPADEPGDAS